MNYAKAILAATLAFAISGMTLMRAVALGGEKSASSVEIETVATSVSWVSPWWGYNAPKIVQNARGEVWAVNLFGRYPASNAQIYKRRSDGAWQPGKVFSGSYQPAMIFLDNDGRLNLIQNSETEPIHHFRSTDDKNLNNFELIASGNGLEDGRGWYVGVGVHGPTIYLSYITLSYNLYLTWKSITDKNWHKAILVHQGEVNPIRGNHSWLYPRFYFHGSEGYIAVSSTVDGTTHNTYNKIYVVSFPLKKPEEFTSELVCEGPVGYYTYCTDMIVMRDGTIICGFRAGQRKYGPEQSSALPPGLYVAVRGQTDKKWNIHQIDDHDGIVTLNYSKKGEVYTVVTRGSWDQENLCLVKKSTNQGRTWEIVNGNIFAHRPNIDRPFFMQTAHTPSGSMTENTILGLLTNLRSTKPTDGLYTFDLLEIKIPMD